MVRAPSFDGFVPTNPIQGPRAPRAPSPDSFGGAAARLAVNIFADEKRKADEVAASKAVREIRNERIRLLHDPQGGLLYKKGEDLFAATGPGRQSLEQFMGERLDALSPDQRAMAEAQAHGEMDRFTADLAQHEGQALIEYDAGELDANVSSMSEAAVKSANSLVTMRGNKLDTSAMDAEVFNIKEEFRAFATRRKDLLGISPEKWMEKNVPAAISRHHLAVVQELLGAEQPDKAVAYVEHYAKAMLSGDRDAARRMVADTKQLNEITDVFDRASFNYPIDHVPERAADGSYYYADGRSPEEARELILEAIDDEAQARGWSEQTRLQARDYAESEINASKRRYELRAQEMTRDLMSHLQGLGGNLHSLREKRQADLDFIGADNRMVLAKFSTALKEEATDSWLSEQYSALELSIRTSPDEVRKKDPAFVMAPFRGTSWEEDAQKLLNTLAHKRVQTLTTIGRDYAPYKGEDPSESERDRYNQFMRNFLAELEFEGGGNAENVSEKRAHEIAGSLRSTVDLDPGWLSWGVEKEAYKFELADVPLSVVPPSFSLKFQQAERDRRKGTGEIPWDSLPKETREAMIRMAALHAIRTSGGEGL